MLPQSIVCRFHPGRPADTLLTLHGANAGEDWSENVCLECDEELKQDAEKLSGKQLTVIDFQGIFDGNS